MFLPLAERMVEKMVKEEKIEAEAEVSRASASPPCCVVWMQKLRFRFRCLCDGSTSGLIIQVHFIYTARFHQTQICLKKLFCTSHSSVHPLRASSQIRKTPHKNSLTGKNGKNIKFKIITLRWIFFWDVSSSCCSSSKKNLLYLKPGEAETWETFLKAESKMWIPLFYSCSHTHTLFCQSLCLSSSSRQRPFFTVRQMFLQMFLQTSVMILTRWSEMCCHTIHQKLLKHRKHLKHSVFSCLVQVIWCKMHNSVEVESKVKTEGFLMTLTFTLHRVSCC